jgi:uncharacterized protein (DUF2141 family)
MILAALPRTALFPAARASHRHLGRTLLAAGLVASGAAGATDVTFEVTGLESAQGQVLVALYDEGSFLKKPVKAMRLASVAGKVSGSLGAIPEGAYALTVVHDENANGKLDRNMIGMPTEKYGFSNNPSLFGPPAFKDARIEITGAAQRISVVLR